MAKYKHSCKLLEVLQLCTQTLALLVFFIDETRYNKEEISGTCYLLLYGPDHLQM